MYNMAENCSKLGAFTISLGIAFHMGIILGKRLNL